MAMTSSSTTSSSFSASASSRKKKNDKTSEMEKILAEIRSHDKSALFADTSTHNPDLQMSLDAVQQKMDKRLYKRPRDFVQDMNMVFTVDADSPLASAASSFLLLLQCLLDKYHMVDLGSRSQGSSKRHRRGSKRAKAEVFDFVAEFEEELSSGFLFEGEQFLDSSSDEHHLFANDDDEVDDEDLSSSAEDFVPLSFSFEQESVLDGRSPALYSELLGEYGWSEWEDPVSDDSSSASSPKTTCASDAGDSSLPSSPLSSPNSCSTAASPVSGSSSGGGSLQSKRGSKRQRSSSHLRVSSMRWSKEELLFKITNELPSDKLEGLIMIVNPSLEFGDTDDEDLEFDINALDEATLYRLEDYVHACLEDSKDGQGNESMLDHHHHHGRGAEIITITQTIEETVTTSPRKRTKSKGQASASRSSRKATTAKTATMKNTQAKPQQQQTLPSPIATKKSTTRTQRRKNASPAKTKSPGAAVTTTQVIETTICHFVEQDEDFNYIPHSRGARLNTLVPEAFEVFRTEQVIKVHKSVSDSDMEEEVDII